VTRGLLRPGAAWGSRLRRGPAAIAGLLLAAGALLASGAAPWGASRAAAAGAVVTFALPPASTSTYIFPLQGLADAGPVDDNEFQMLLFRPLYWFGKNGVSTINYGLSLAKAPIYSNHGRTVTIHLNHYRWSDGTPVTSRDVQFWMDELEAEKANWYGYVPGGFPDNVTAAAYPNRSTVVLTFKAAYNPVWLLDNELSQITPIPQHAWDRTSAGGAVGNADRTPRGAVAVYNFLNTQSKTLHTYTSNPLWKVVDGPWRLKSYDPTTQAMGLVPNRAYSGPDRPRIAEIEEVPFTSYAAEFDALRGGQLDYGYLPPPDYTQAGYFRSHGYRIQPWPIWATAYAVYNFTNPVAGPIFKQLYFRQAIQRLVDQPQDVKSIWHGFAVPTYGPVPIKPVSPYLDKAETVNPYPYSVSIARRLLESHGWRRRGGVMRCESPGRGAQECGPGVNRGAAATFSLVYTSGNIAFTQELESLESSMSEVGIQLRLSQAPFATVEGDAFSCNPKTGSGCSWDLAMWAGWSWDPDYQPLPDEIFATGAVGNAGKYSSPAGDAVIQADYTKTGTAPVERADLFFARQLPVVWMPGFDYQVSVVKDSLHGTQPQDPVGNIYPERWTVG